MGKEGGRRGEGGGMGGGGNGEEGGDWEVWSTTCELSLQVMGGKGGGRRGKSLFTTIHPIIQYIDIISSLNNVV